MESEENSTEIDAYEENRLALLALNEATDLLMERCLDIAVAKALGWTTRCLPTKDAKGYLLYQLLDHNGDVVKSRYWWNDSGIWEMTPYFSDRLDTAWQAVEIMRSKGWCPTMHETHPQGGVYVAGFGDATAYYTRRSGYSPAEAFCRAIIATLGPARERELQHVGYVPPEMASPSPPPHKPA